ncbi:hypothetical protein BT96DRAFT_921159 [Gymnopus androsaceus JB14]|uniref:F-box domain-containing protein n=1 Tax=Gymnopus androsaceus JB14 TaxID=1447944 RepID=A0A6A4HH39_9AGAR|nr:hypothetical protein BT96DRAFT_921159 [Gymnopus androsaceus JB14]
MPEAVYTATISLVRRLSSLNSLSFNVISWESLPPLLKAALTEICKAPSVTQFSANHFYISIFAELASLLSRMKSLKILDLDMIHYNWEMPNFLSELGIEEDSLPPRSIQLDELRLYNARHFMDCFQRDSCPTGVRNLKSLGMRSQADMATLQCFGTSIRELTLDGYPVNQAVHALKLQFISHFESTLHCFYFCSFESAS